MNEDETTVWAAVRDQCEALEPGSELVTPLSERPFRVQMTTDDRVAIRFDDSGEERDLWRDQFEVLANRIQETGLTVSDLPPGVEPYASVLTLLADYDVEHDEIGYVPGSKEGSESPYLISPVDARTRPKRLHDDAILLADLLDSLDPVEPETLETGSLTDLYVLLSDVQHEADRFRQVAREALLARLGPGQELHARYGTVRRTTRERRQPKDDESVFDALDERGIPREWVLGVDRDKLDVVLAVTDLEEDAVYDVEEQVYVQKTDVEEDEKYSRLQGLAKRLEEIEGAKGEKLREEFADLEHRLDEALSA